MIRLLDAVADSDEWLRVWRKTGREPFAHPAYASLFAAAGERAVLVVIEEGEGIAVVPFLMRPLPGVPDRWDATSPYGYGGPFIAGHLGHERVLEAIAEWLTLEGLCSVFLRFSLDFAVDAGGRGVNVEVQELFDNVVVDLQREPAEIWMGYEHKVRKNVNKALRAGCTVHRSEGPDRLDDFLDVYQDTMRRRGAAAWFHFDKAFFSALTNGLESSNSIFEVRNGAGKVVSAELVLESETRLYSFLGGTREEAFAFAPNDLLKHEVILHGHRTGRSAFVLGGGYQAGDGIFRYKRSFAPRGIMPFRVARLIGDRPLYDRLLQQRRGGTHTTDPLGDFFPAYRSPVTAAARLSLPTGEGTTTGPFAAQPGIENDQ